MGRAATASSEARSRRASEWRKGLGRQIHSLFTANPIPHRLSSLRMSVVLSDWWARTTEDVLAHRL